MRNLLILTRFNIIQDAPGRIKTRVGAHALIRLILFDMLKRFAKFIFIFLGSLYLIGCGVLYVVQEDILFRPQPIPENTSFRFGEEVSIPVAENINLHGLYSRESRPKGVILYLHGNRGNARWCQRQAEMFTGFGYNVFLLDYRGYGKSDGEISSSSQLYSDVQKVYDYLKKEFSESEIILAGYSLGTGMASYLAANNQPNRLFLIAPFVSIVDMKDRIFPFVPDFLIKYPLNNQSHLSRLNCPVTVFHGTDDEVIPYDASEDLKRMYPQKIELIKLPSTGHRGAIFHSAIRSTLGRYLG